jgi:hypothetical protein
VSEDKEHRTRQQADGNTLVRELAAGDLALAQEITHEFGLRRATTESSLPVVCCLVRDGDYWLPGFLDHYRQAGIKEFFFLDNGSKDDTLAILSRETGVGVYSVARTLFREYNANLRRILIRRVRPQGWVLAVDIDELFDYPYSDQINLVGLCRYLDRYDFNCMTTHMLDMVPDARLSDLPALAGQDPRDTHTYYSLAGLQINDYRCIGDQLTRFGSNGVQLPGSDWKFMCDGFRNHKFGSRIWLTKHALLKLDNGLLPFVHQHLHAFCRIADLSGVLYHYKLSPGFRETVERALEERQYSADSADYRSYSKALHSGEEVRLKDEHSVRLTTIVQLLDHGFLDVSDDFLHRAVAE